MTISINPTIKTETPQLKLLITELEFTYEKKQSAIWDDLLNPLIVSIEQHDQ